ncbi:sulfotransferase family 2 domain-containing protein [Fulvivirgaceae bacterium BMA10]|uniref:Sulfotransferase family 2 domain-containing protein n=1 Tax=Splendidivirga corallicola TaxID=3051826 RepID=A0ABT8KSE5_9BACT|nr:sulfotransferase family 2 domain-containing protein [Fulvivirgaceae bacterium BMA10]
MVETDKVVFLHIPKAGGTTLRHILLSQYERKNIFYTVDGNPDQSEKKYLGLDEKSRNGIKLVIGHIGFSDVFFLNDKKKFITMLRDPVARVISHYYYAKKSPDHYLYNHINEKKLTLMEYVQEMPTIELENGQTRLISGLNVPLGACSNEMLEMAKKNLKMNFTAVGLMERFDESLILYKRRLNWRNPYYIKANVSKEKKNSTVSQEIIDIILENNQFDIALYEFVKQNFDQEVRDAGFSMNMELNTFKTMNFLYQKYSRAKKAAKYVFK